MIISYRAVRLSLLAGLLTVMLALPRQSLAQPPYGEYSPGEHMPHRVLPPDSARLSQLQAQAALLYRLQQFSGQQQQIPGVTDPDRQKRLQQIMQQMAMKLGQSSLQMPGARHRPGRSPSRSGIPRSQPAPGNFPPDADQSGSKGSKTPLESLRTFLERMTGRPLDQNPLFNEPPDDFGQETQPGEFPAGRGTGYSRNPSLSGTARPGWLEPPDSRRNPGSSPFDDASDSSLSLTERLSRIADRARVDSLGPPGSQGGDSGRSSWLSNAGLQAAFAKALEGAADSIAERVATSDDTERGQPEPRRDPRRGDDGPGAAEWISDLAGRATAASVAVHESMTSSPPDNSNRSSSFSSTSLVQFGLLLAGMGAAFWWLQRREPDSESESLAAAVAKMPRSIRTREDIVAAFHVIAARAPEVGAVWWTHRRAAYALVEANPESREAFEVLTELYERARYLPGDEPLTHEQLSAASQAVRRIRRS